MDETNKVKYEQLQGTLDNDLKEWVKKDPIWAKAILQRRRQLKEMSPEQRTLSIMRSALRVARENRRRDLKMMDERIYNRSVAADKAGMGTSDGDREVLKQAAYRDMLAKQILVNAAGEQRVVDRDYVKDREPYQKRPTTRAIKKHREKSKGLSM